MSDDIPVKPVDSIDVDDTEEFSMEDELREAIELLERYLDISEQVLSCSVVISTVPDTTFPDGEETAGDGWRVLNGDAHHHYENGLKFLSDIERFDYMLKQTVINPNNRPETQTEFL